MKCQIDFHEYSEQHKNHSYVTGSDLAHDMTNLQTMKFKLAKKLKNHRKSMTPSVLQNTSSSI